MSELVDFTALVDAAEMHVSKTVPPECDDEDCGCADALCQWCGDEWPCLVRRLADALESAPEAILESAARQMETYAKRTDNRFTEHVLVEAGAPMVLREYAAHYKKEEAS